MNFKKLLDDFRLTGVIPYLKVCDLVWYRAVRFVPDVAMSSATGPQDFLVTVFI